MVCLTKPFLLECDWYVFSLSVSFHSRLLLPAANHIICIYMVLQQTYQMWCVAASLCSLLCCVTPVTQQLTRNCGWRLSKACTAWPDVHVHFGWRYNFDGFFFLYYFVDVKMFARVLFFLHCANAGGFVVLVAVWMPCFGAGMLWLCVGYDRHSLCDPTKRPELELRFSSHRLVPLQGLCVSDSSNSGFFTDLDNAAAGCASHCVLRLLSVDQIQWEHRGDATFSPSYRHVQLRLYWECTDWWVISSLFSISIQPFTVKPKHFVGNQTFDLQTCNDVRFSYVQFE